MKNFIHLKKLHAPTLILFPHAGALPQQYKSWCSHMLINHFDIYIYKKLPITNWHELIIQLKNTLIKIDADQLIVFGHSWGAILAYFFSGAIIAFTEILIFTNKKNLVELLLSAYITFYAGMMFLNGLTGFLSYSCVVILCYLIIKFLLMFQYSVFPSRKRQ